jgi:glycosyltransferase involved in cell wall biosynthesis
MLPREKVELVVLFTGNRNHESLKELVSRFTEFGESKSPAGVWAASRRLRPLLTPGRAVYSLMRASHLVLGLLPRRTLRGVRLAGSFHQFPSHDRRGARGQLEDVLVKRATRCSRLLTSPSERAVQELLTQGYLGGGEAVLESNIIQLSSEDVPPVRDTSGPLRLLFAGRLSSQKGLDRLPALLDATSRPVHVRIAGEGEQRAALEVALASTPPRHRIEFLGHRSDIAALIDWSDALLLLSRWELNPVIVWEGWARGKGTLGWDISALRDLDAYGPIWIVGDTDGFRDGVDQIADIDARRRVQAEALASVADRGPSRIASFLNG